MEGKSINLRLSLKLYERILSFSARTSAQDFIRKCIEERLAVLEKGGSRNVLESKESRSETTQSQAGRSVLDTVGVFIRDNPDWLSKIPEDKQAQIISTIGLKLAQSTSGSDSEALSLRDSLKGLPELGDLTQELSIVKGHLYKTQLERDLALTSLRGFNDFEKRKAFVEKVFSGITELIWQWLSRNSVPGIGSGGGLTEKAREEVANEASKWLSKNVTIY